MAEGKYLISHRDSNKRHIYSDGGIYSIKLDLIHRLEEIVLQGVIAKGFVVPSTLLQGDMIIWKYTSKGAAAIE